jgi:hypothetical protein
MGRTIKLRRKLPNTIQAVRAPEAAYERRLVYTVNEKERFPSILAALNRNRSLLKKESL